MKLQNFILPFDNFIPTQQNVYILFCFVYPCNTGRVATPLNNATAVSVASELLRDQIVSQIELLYRNKGLQLPYYFIESLEM